MTMVAERTLGQKIRRAREHKGWTQTVLAEELGVSLMAVSAWETDTRLPRVSVRPKVWSVLGLAPSDFDTDPPPSGQGAKANGREIRDYSEQAQYVKGEVKELARQVVSSAPFSTALAIAAIAVALVIAATAPSESLGTAYDDLPLAQKLEVGKALTAMYAALESEGEREVAERLRHDFAQHEFRGLKIVLAILGVSVAYLTSQNKDAARRALHAEIDAIEGEVRVA